MIGEAVHHTTRLRVITISLTTPLLNDPVLTLFFIWKIVKMMTTRRKPPHKIKNGERTINTHRNINGNSGPKTEQKRQSKKNKKIVKFRLLIVGIDPLLDNSGDGEKIFSVLVAFDFGSFRVFLALFCAICGLFTPKVEVSGKEGEIPLSCSELF